MKAQELRIGNYVFSKETQKHQMIVGVTLENPFIDAITFDYTTYNEIEPIPLTEKWLKNLGFKKGRKGFWFQGGVEYNPKKFDLSFFGYVEIKYVNQLQNLYFALTGEELQL